MTPLKNLSQIDTNRIEGRLLLSALSMLSGTHFTDKHPDEILEEVHKVAEHIYKDAPLPDFSEPEKRPMFEESLRLLINGRSLEDRSDTPDYILAQYLSNCLGAYESAIKSRDKWFGVDMWAADKLKNPELVPAVEFGDQTISFEEVPINKI